MNPLENGRPGEMELARGGRVSLGLDHDPGLRTCLVALSPIYPDAESVLARIAHLSAELTLPRGTIHVVSDVHGEFKKLRHVINNASGSLRILVDETFGDSLRPEEKLELLNLIYYPREMLAHLEPRLSDPAVRRRFLQDHTRRACILLRRLAPRYTLDRVEAMFPERLRLVFRELLFEPELARSPDFVNAMLDPVLRHGESPQLLRDLAHAIRNLLISEVIVAGDLGDRGPRLDKVVEFLMRQPSVAITFGNHDVSWLAACLGEETSIATVLRLSLRYGRLSQLEEGYGIPLAPIEKLARTVYGDDPATRYAVKGEGLRDPLTMARMQKAIAILQFKLEGQLIARNPELGMQHRALLAAVDPAQGTVRIDGKAHPLLDTRFPTVDFRDPFRLTPEEQACIDHLKSSFLFSPVLWQHAQFIARNGSMYLERDGNLIFHGCVPVDAQGGFLSLPVDGEPRAGRALFDALDEVIRRAVRSRERRDLDLLYYLWTGPLSPLFGKDRMTTFERHYVEDPATHKESKNPYFKLIHDRGFCQRIFREFGVSGDQGVIVNGHVPVKLEAGESPVKSSGLAITIDGAFSEAYGDKGYTLILDADRTAIAQHHHFESVESAIAHGADIVPSVENVKVYDRPRTVGDGARGEAIRREIELLEQLLAAYRDNALC